MGSMQHSSTIHDVLPDWPTGRARLSSQVQWCSDVNRCILLCAGADTLVNPFNNQNLPLDRGLLVELSGGFRYRCTDVDFGLQAQQALLKYHSILAGQATPGLDAFGYTFNCIFKSTMFKHHTWDENREEICTT